MQKGLTVIERGSIERIFEEQRFTLSHGSESSMLRAGHLLGAAQAVFISSGLSDIYLKGVDVESGQVLWAVNGKYPYSCLDRASFEFANTHCAPHDLIRGALDSVWNLSPSSDRLRTSPRRTSTNTGLLP